MPSANYSVHGIDIDKFSEKDLLRDYWAVKLSRADEELKHLFDGKEVSAAAYSADLLMRLKKYAIAKDIAMYNNAMSKLVTLTSLDVTNKSKLELLYMYCYNLEKWHKKEISLGHYYGISTFPETKRAIKAINDEFDKIAKEKEVK